jgi:enoyl-CoA hydratase/carnithine racemase
MTETAVLVNSYPTEGGQQIIEVTLNAPKSLNALSGEMIGLLLAQLPSWEDDPDVAVIVLRGAGERAFCAGGDIRQMYAAMQVGEIETCQTFFNLEYSLDLMLHRMQTPLLVWGQGYVMGGGVGLLQGAGLRFATHSTRLAMPEVSIGLFPDVGASYFLHKVPEGLGLFLGLTGAVLNGTDARELNLVDALLSDADYDVLLKSLQNLPKQTNNEQLSSIRKLVKDLEAMAEGAPTSDLAPHKRSIINALTAQDLNVIFSELQKLKGVSRWLDKAIATMESGSPTSLHLTFRQLRQAPQELEKSFVQEHVLAVNSCRKGEFLEGVRALLIDKDQRPQWRYDTISEVPNEWIDSFYQSQNIAKPDFEV